MRARSASPRAALAAALVALGAARAGAQATSLTATNSIVTSNPTVTFAEFTAGTYSMGSSTFTYTCANNRYCAIEVSQASSTALQWNVSGSGTWTAMPTAGTWVKVVPTVDASSGVVRNQSGTINFRYQLSFATSAPSGTPNQYAAPLSLRIRECTTALAC
jgi:hypothetical protein